MDINVQISLMTYEFKDGFGGVSCIPSGENVKLAKSNNPPPPRMFFMYIEISIYFSIK